jgi:aldehyde:ferredoxin oxidoreductase
MWRDTPCRNLRDTAYEADFSDRVDRRRATPEAAALAIETEDKAALMDSLILCKFLRGAFEDFYAESAEMLRLVTGWDVTGEEFRTTAARIVAAKKYFNIEAGWRPEEDTLPERFLTTALSDDPQARLPRERLAGLIQAYHRRRGWMKAGFRRTSYSGLSCADANVRHG